MHPESRNPSQKYPSSKSLAKLFEAQRRASALLYTELQNWLSTERTLLKSPPPHEHTRLRALFEKAFELSRQAEAKIELFISHLGGRP